MSESSGCSTMGALALVASGVLIGYALRNKIGAGFQYLDRKVDEWDRAAKAKAMQKRMDEVTATSEELKTAVVPTEANPDHPQQS